MNSNYGLDYGESFVYSIHADMSSYDLTLKSAYVDCNKDGLFDDSVDYVSGTKSISQVFECYAYPGDTDSSIGVVLFKNNTKSWDYPRCSHLAVSDQYCRVQFETGLMINE